MQLHTKRRNRLEQTRLNDLVFIKYNRALIRRHNIRDSVDPITFDEIDESNEWLVGRLQEEHELVYENDDLTWDDVARAVGCDEAPYAFRSQEQGQVGSSNVASSSTSLHGIEVCEEENNENLPLDDEEEDISLDDLDDLDI